MGTIAGDGEPAIAVLLRCLFEFFGPAAGDGDRPSGLMQRQRDGSANAAASTGDHGNLRCHGRTRSGTEVPRKLKLAPL
jgi:hypothetical protein